MANDIIDINVYETTETVEITVNPNLTTVNINKVTSSSGAGITNLSTTQTASNFTINSDTGDDALVPLGNGTLAGGTLNNYTTAEKNKLAGITGTNTGDQNLQSVTNLGATTTNTITVNSATYGIVTNTTIGILAEADETAIIGNGYLYGVIGEANYFDDFGDGAAIEGRSNSSVAGSFIAGATADGIIIESGTTSTGIPFKVSKNSVTKASINQAGELTAQKLIKDGGTASQILAADGSVITAGNNITITGGQISSVGGTGGGGSSVNYYLNGGTSQGTFAGTTYYEFSKTAVIGTGADFSRGSNGLIASFITDIADPSLLLIPAGNWNLEFFFSASSNGGSPSFYVELYKYDGTTFTSIASSSATPEGITGGTAIDAYFTPLAVPETVLTVNDRLAIRVFVNASSKTITLHTQNGHLCEVITTFTAGLTALNGLQAQVQNFATGTTGTDFAINSSGSTHTFNLPSASATARGLVSTTTQTFAGAKTFTSIDSTAITGNSTEQNGIIGTSVEGTGIAGTSVDDLGVYGGSINAEGAIFNTVNGTTIVGFYTNSVLRATVNSDGTFAGTGLNASGQTINTIASFDGSKNVVSLPTATYPSLTELTYAKGVTSGIQSQFSGKQDTLQNTVNIKSINGSSILGSGDLTISGTGISSLNGLTGATQTFSATTNTGTGIPAWTSLGTNHQLNIPIAGGATTTGLITGTSQIISGSKQFLSNPEIPVPAGNSGTCIVLGTTGGGGATGTLQIGSTTLYPTALEMQYVKGITSHIQTQLDGKQPTLTAGNGINITTNTISTVDTSRAAYTMLANNTNASAIPTTQVFKDVGEQSYAGATPTWTGTTAPSGTTNHSYQWLQIGKVVNLRVNLDYATAGTSLTAVTFDLPSDCPIPKLPLGVSANGDVIAYGNGMLVGLRTTPATPTTVTCALRIKGTGTYEINILRITALGHKYAYANIQYFAQ